MGKSASLGLTACLSACQQSTPGATPTPACRDAADSEDSGDLNISDAIHVLGYLFASSPPPPAPGPDACGVDPTDDGLGCEFYSCL